MRSPSKYLGGLHVHKGSIAQEREIVRYRKNGVSLRMGVARLLYQYFFFFFCDKHLNHSLYCVYCNQGRTKKTSPDSDYVPMPFWNVTFCMLSTYTRLSKHCCSIIDWSLSRHYMERVRSVMYTCTNCSFLFGAWVKLPLEAFFSVDATSVKQWYTCTVQRTCVLVRVCTSMRQLGAPLGIEPWTFWILVRHYNIALAHWAAGAPKQSRSTYIGKLSTATTSICLYDLAN